MFDLRRRTIGLATAVALMLLWSPSPVCSEEEKAKIEVGQKAPDFELTDQNGKSVTLKDLLEKKSVALVFYRSADW